MYKRLRKSINAFSLKGAAIFTFPRCGSFFSRRGEILPQPWKDLVTAVKN